MKSVRWLRPFEVAASKIGEALDARHSRITQMIGCHFSEGDSASLELEPDGTLLYLGYPIDAKEGVDFVVIE